MEFPIAFLFTLAVLAGLGALLRQAKAKRQAEEHRRREEAAAQYRADLVARFGEGATSRILAGELWIGCPEPALAEMFGEPAGLEEKVQKTGTRRLLKYFQTGANRYALRVTVEDGEVSGWEDKRRG